MVPQVLNLEVVPVPRNSGSSTSLGGRQLYYRIQYCLQAHIFGLLVTILLWPLSWQLLIALNPFESVPSVTSR